MGGVGGTKYLNDVHRFDLGKVSFYSSYALGDILSKD